MDLNQNMLATEVLPARLKMLPNQDFMKILKSRIAELVRPDRQRATVGAYVRVLIVLAWFSLSFVGLLLSKSTALSVFLCVSLGLAIAAVGFNVFHDSVHGAFSYRRWINRFWAFISCSLIGPSHFIWRHKHNYLHHQYPNIEGWDDDLETRGGLRLSPSQRWSARYRYQHLYAPVVYALTTMEWVFVRDFVRYFSSKMNESQRLPKMKVSDHVEFWMSKIIYVALTVVLPLTIFPLRKFLIGFLIVHVTASLVLAVVFQLAHVMKESQFPKPNQKSGRIDLDWAQLQLATTVNFAPTNKLLSWYCGGLNFQIEHHLLPGVCHSHYKKVSPLVKATAEEFGYPYHSLPTHWQALRDHFGMLKRLSLPQP